MELTEELDFNAMIDDMMQETIMLKQDEFYAKPFQFSYSSLSKLLWNPAVFYQLYILGNKEERLDSHLVQGKLIHCLLLEEENINDQFMITPSNVPTGNPRIVADRVFRHYEELSRNGDNRTELVEFESAILDVMKDMNYFQNLKTDAQRIEKVITPDILHYWEFLKKKNGKILVNQEDFDFCKNAVDLMKTNKNICDLIACNTSDFQNIDVYNEIALDCQVTGKSFGLKGIIDNLVLDHDKKVIRINDIKTTSKELKDFPETVEYYSYWLQAVIYCTLVGVKYSIYIEQGYSLEFNFIVINKTFQVYAFPVTQETLNSWFSKLTKTLETAEWHYVNKSYDLPQEFALGKVSL